MELFDALVARLRELFPDCAVGEEAEGAAPSLRVRLLTGSSKSYPSGRFKRTYSIQTVYTPAGETPQQECRQMAEQLADGLETVGDLGRASREEWSIAEGKLQFVAEYTVYVREQRPEELPMEGIQSRVTTR